MSEYDKTNYKTIKPFEPTNEIEQGYLDDILSVFENEIKVTGIKEYQSPYSTSETVLIEYVSHPDFDWREDDVFTYKNPKTNHTRRKKYGTNRKENTVLSATNRKIA